MLCAFPFVWHAIGEKLPKRGLKAFKRYFGKKHSDFAYI